jgi:hypothetical protein
VGDEDEDEDNARTEGMDFDQLVQFKSLPPLEFSFVHPNYTGAHAVDLGNIPRSVDDLNLLPPQPPRESVCVCVCVVCVV